MPKKYHRPPTAKRRKKKKNSTPRILEPLPEDETDNSATVVQDVAPDEPGDEYGDDYDDEFDEDEFVEEPAAEPVEVRRTSVQHLVTDYGYVLTELRLSLGLAAFLIVALIITAILR